MTTPGARSSRSRRKVSGCTTSRANGSTLWFGKSLVLKVTIAPALALTTALGTGRSRSIGASWRVDALGRGRRCRAPPRTSRWLSGCVWELRCSHRDRLHRRSRPCDRVRRAARSMPARDTREHRRGGPGDDGRAVRREFHPTADHAIECGAPLVRCPLAIRENIGEADPAMTAGLFEGPDSRSFTTVGRLTPKRSATS
jgi:hypothetical protein